MVRHLLLATALILSSSTAWAHGSGQHVLGTVTAIDASHIEVKTPKGAAVSVKVTKQTRYIEKGKTWVDSLQNQAATQLVLINKLQTDTKQRVVLYDALTKSLKTAQQQDVVEGEPPARQASVIAHGFAHSL